MENTNQYKRQERKMSQTQKDRISASLRAKNIKHSKEWNEKISAGAKRYWEQIPQSKGNLTMQDYLEGGML